MWNDDEQLQEELNWRPRKSHPHERTPRGASAMMAMGGALMLPMWGMTMARVGSVSDLGVIKLLLVFALEGLVAMAIAQVLWRVIGPVGRTLIRPLMILGPLPPLVLICCSGMGLGASTGVLKKPNPHLLSRGSNWGIPREGDSVRFSDVQALCTKLGPQWRMARQEELARLEPAPPLGVMARRDIANAAYTDYWLQPARDTSPRQDVFLRVLCMNKQCRPELHRKSKGSSEDGENTATALCVDF
jgi:hypothetical protein